MKVHAGTIVVFCRESGCNDWCGVKQNHDQSRPKPSVNDASIRWALSVRPFLAGPIAIQVNALSEGAGRGLVRRRTSDSTCPTCSSERESISWCSSSRPADTTQVWAVAAPTVE